MRKRTKFYKFIIDIHLLPVIITPLALWLISGYHKFKTFVTGTMWGPDPSAWIPWLKTHFNGIVLMDNYFIIVCLFFTLMILQLLTGILFLVGLLKGEFIITRTKHWLSAAFIFSMINIALLSFGQNLANDDNDVFQLTSYFVAHLFCLFYINYVTEKFFLKDRRELTKAP